jgi:hypothetical protein
MNKLKMVCQNQKLDRDPSLEQIPMGRYGVVVDGVNLPCSVIEDVRGLSLRPSYSGKQLRRIERLAKKNAGRERRCPLSLRHNNKNLPTWRFIKPSVGDLLTTGQIRRESDRYINGDLEWTEKILAMAKRPKLRNNDARSHGTVVFRAS